jgi:16S rRNA (adenine1518-N6/adenine1519-N6)-dimethyltransferase
MRGPASRHRAVAAGEGGPARARRRFGQHFLVDAAIVERIAAAIPGAAGARVIEIGGGRGALTTALVRRGFALTVLEVDRDLAALLRERFPGLDVRVADALRFDFAGCGSTSVVGNLPYNISTPLLLALAPLGGAAGGIRDMTFMLQAEVVDRIVAVPGAAEYGRLGVMLGYHCDAEVLFNVGTHAFRPRPRVQSKMLRLVPRGGPPPPPLFADVVRAAFSGRRKMLRNGLAGLADAPVLLAALSAAGIDPTRRPETLSVAEYVAVATALGESRPGAAAPRRALPAWRGQGPPPEVAAAAGRDDGEC